MPQPIRTCLGCRRRLPRSRLVRLAVVRGCVAVDRDRRLPGRGAWVCPKPSCAQTALSDGGRRLRRALRADAGAVTLDDEALRAAVPAAPPPPDASRGVTT